MATVPTRTLNLPASVEDASLGAAVDARGLCRSYARGQQRVAALDDVSFVLPDGSVTAIVGPSGSGKSTLLHILAGLARPNAGQLRIGGKNVLQMGPRALARFRNRDVGVIFQAFNLLPGLTVRENVLFPLYFGSVGVRDGQQRVDTMLELVGLTSVAGRRPAQLSGGEQQRVAIARALVTNPPLILADEPTGNLDEPTAVGIAGLLFRLAREFHKTLVLVTHHPALALQADRQIRLVSGQIVAEESRPCS